jgi:hypothetical protein
MAGDGLTNGTTEIVGESRSSGGRGLPDGLLSEGRKIQAGFFGLRRQVVR